MKRFLVIAGVLVLLVGTTVYVGYSYWKSTPEYAFAQIKSAVDTHDKALFYRFVDVETLIGRAVDDIIADSQEEQDVSEASWANDLAQGFAKLIQPRLVEFLTDEVDKMIEKPGGERDEMTPAGELPDDVPNLPLNPMDIDNLEFEGIKEKASEGKITTVVLAVRNRKLDLPLNIELLMREVDGGHLQLFQLSNLRAVIDSVEEAEHAWKVAQNQPIRDRLNNLLQTTNLNFRSKSDRWGLDKSMTFTLELKNISESAVTGCVGTLIFRDKDTGEIHAELPVHAEGHDPVMPGASYTMEMTVDINPFVEDQQRLWEIDGDKHTYELVLTQAKLRDGSTLSIPYPEVD